MKKINILLSALVLAISTLSPMASFAVETQKSDSIELSKTQAPTFKMVIPAGTTALEENQEFEVKASAILEYNKALTISVESTNNWNLQDTNFSENEISYTMKYGDTEIEAQEVDILAVPSGDEEHSVTLTVCSIGKASHAGTYKDVLTFTAKTDTTTEQAPSS